MDYDRRPYADTSSPPSPSSLRQKLRSSIRLSPCFGGAPDSAGDERPVSLIRSSSTWLRSRAQELPDLVSRIGRHRHRQSAGGFHYDPLSYALNFDDGADEEEKEPQCHNFSSRIPASPTAVGVA